MEVFQTVLKEAIEITSQIFAFKMVAQISKHKIVLEMHMIDQITAQIPAISAITAIAVIWVTYRTRKRSPTQPNTEDRFNKLVKTADELEGL